MTYEQKPWSGWQNSPIKKEIPKITASTKRDDPQYKLIQELKDDLAAKKITQAEYNDAIKEIKEYKDLD